MLKDEIKKFLEGEENSELYFNKLNSLIDEEVYKIIKIYENPAEANLLKEIIYQVINYDITNLHKDYEEYVIECNVNGRRILDKKGYLEAYISEINIRECEFLDIMYMLIQEVVNINKNNEN